MTVLASKCVFVFGIGLVITPKDIRLAAEKFALLELETVGDLAENLNTKSVVFVDDKPGVGLMNDVKTFSRRFVYHTVVNKSYLRGILGRPVEQLSFFQTRTAIVTKEQLKLTLLLRKVSSPHFLTWIVFRDHKLFPKLDVPPSNKVVFVNSTSAQTSLVHVYHPKPEENARVKYLNHSAETAVATQLEKIDFQNVSMKMLVFNQKDACLRVNGTLRKLECVHQELLESIGLRLNFRIHVVECMEKEYPFAYPNGTDSELFIKLKNREVDFSAVGYVILRKNKRNYMEFVWPTFVLKTRMYLRQGRPVGRWLTYLRPLENSVWWAILIWIAITGILIQIFEKLLKKQLKFDFSLLLDFIMSTLKALQVFCNQALTDIPIFCSVRIIFFLKFFIVLIFFQAYCGYLVSSLTVVVSRFPFRDLKGFFENQQYQIMTLRRGFHHFYFRKEIGEGHKKNFMLPQDDLPHTIQQAIDRLCEQKYLAFSEFREDLLNFERMNCKISELPTPVAFLYVGIGMPKGTPLKEFFRRELLHLKATGLVKRLGSRLSSHSDFREKQRENEFTTVSMSQVFSIFVFLGMGIALSISILIIELILHRCRSSSTDLEMKLRKCSKNFDSSYLTTTSLTNSSLYRNHW